MAAVYCLLVLLFAVIHSNGLRVVHWRQLSLSRSPSFPSSTLTRPITLTHTSNKYLNFATSNGFEDGISLLSMSDYKLEGDRIGGAVQLWLDKEYIRLPVHVEIGSKVSAEYVNLRQAGADDMGEIIMGIGTCLESFDLKDAFVNAWDIANKVGDFLLVLMQRETCECSDDAYKYIAPIDALQVVSKNRVYSITTKKMREVVEVLESKFERFKFIQDFFDGK